MTVAVHNRGVAISEDQLDGIFSAMKRRLTTSKSAGSSTSLGLGLYIADQIVRAHKGKIQVESSEEKGTTFTIHLPRRSTGVSRS